MFCKTREELIEQFGVTFRAYSEVVQRQDVGLRVMQELIAKVYHACETRREALFNHENQHGCLARSEPSPSKTAVQTAFS
jgi:hypothetical protein